MRQSLQNALQEQIDTAASLLETAKRLRDVYQAVSDPAQKAQLEISIHRILDSATLLSNGVRKACH